MRLLKQSTATTVTLPALLDDTDGVTEETGLSPTAGEVFLSKAGGATAAKNEATAPTVDANTAQPRVAIDATDTNTLGILTVYMNTSGALPVERTFTVVPAHVYDGLVSGTDFIQVDVQEMGGAAPEDSADVADAVLTEAVADHSGVAGSLAEEVASHALSSEIAALNDIAAADVLAETLSELSQGQPAATPSLADAIMLLYMAMRNEETQTDSEYTVKNDAGTTVAKATVSDASGTVTKDKMVSGP